jgi:hypothetical protein
MVQKTPNWQPISALPRIASLIDRMVSEALQQWETLKPMKQKPYVLDTTIVERIESAYSNQLETTGLFREQLARWKSKPMSSDQRNEVARLEKQIEKLQTIMNDILSLACEGKEHTIDRILEKDDLELGLEILKGKLRL